jgi:multiple sugar transport system permease protein
MRLELLGPRTRRALVPYLLLLPAGLLLGAIILVPLSRAVGLAFQDFVLTRMHQARFVGLDNFRRAFADQAFWMSLARSAYWVAGNLALQFALGLAFALVLNARFPLRGLVRGLILISWVTPSAVTAMMWIFMLDGQSGIVNDLLVRIGLLGTAFPFLSRPGTAMPSVILANVWFGVPFFAVMLLAALQSIPDELYEAARVDGASTIQAFRYITLSLLLPTIVITSLLRTIWLSQYIETIFLMTGGGPAERTTTLPVYTFLTIRAELDFGYASAMALVLSTVLMAIAALYLVLLRRLEVEL